MGGVVKEFKIGELFEVQKSVQKLSRKNAIENGKIPIYSAESENYGICGYCNEVPSFIVDDQTPFYLVFGDHTKAMNIVNQNFCIADNVKILKPKLKSKELVLYVIGAWKKQIPDLGYARHWSVAKNINFTLPIKNGEIDYDFIKNFIKAIEKLVIKDVVLWADKKIEATKKVINKA